VGGPKIKLDTYGITEIWQPLEHLSLDLLLRYSPERNELLSFVYGLVVDENFPARKDGQLAMSHPFNTAFYLDQAGAGYLSICAGLSHDLVEDQVDQFKREDERFHGKNKISGSKAVKVLDQYEQQVLGNLEEKITYFSENIGVSEDVPRALISIIALLTRHKRHLYYRSIAGIFNCNNEEIKERAIQVKLADRMHNIQRLSAYSEEMKIYQCFKNLFILNNVKRYLVERDVVTEGELVYSSEDTATEKIFRKCCKATYVAFMEVCDDALKKGVRVIKPELQLAFKKYAFQTEGLEEVTDWDDKEPHPLKLYQGIIKKYDSWLHYETDEFERRKEKEKDFCQDFFSEQSFSGEQIEAIINYKDAYALMGVVGRLLYKSDYITDKFGCSDLCTRKKRCISVARKRTENGRSKK